MSFAIRFLCCFLFLFCTGLLPAAPSIADSGREATGAAERAIASCHGNQQCEAAMRKREMLAEEKRRQREAADRALKEASPAGYYLALAGRYLLAAAFIAGAAGLYVLVMHRLFGKRKRRRERESEAKRKSGGDLPR